MENVMTARAHALAVHRGLFIALGLACVALAVLGVFVPGLPTTVFVLAASFFFTRSSPALEAWLERHHWLGPPLRRFRETRGMPRSAKAAALASMWTAIAVSVLALAPFGPGVQLAVVLMGVAGTVTILFIVRTTVARQSLILS
jgi:uncharacterized membrane protein YbaN (DUF454 family)